MVGTFSLKEQRKQVKISCEIEKEDVAGSWGLMASFKGKKSFFWDLKVRAIVFDTWKGKKFKAAAVKR